MNNRLSKTKETSKHSLKIYCPVFNHIKNTIVCSLCCPLRDKCKDFQQFYAINREAQEAAVADYIESHHRLPPGSLLTIQYVLEVLRNMSDTYVWIDQDDRAEVMSYEQILQAAENGRKPKYIFLTKQELMLRYQLVPKSRQETAKEVTKPLKVADLPITEASDESQDHHKKRSGKAVA
ncbi:MAG: hypothetical protein FD167_4992 [bacterium]|nr:MAG: hypothetical protein FD167_4992 [bacterium]